MAVPGDAEAIVHSARSFCASNLDLDDAVLFLKIDEKNIAIKIQADDIKSVMQEIKSQRKRNYTFASVRS